MLRHTQRNLKPQKASNSIKYLTKVIANSFNGFKI